MDCEFNKNLDGPGVVKIAPGEFLRKMADFLKQKSLSVLDYKGKERDEILETLGLKEEKEELSDKEVKEIKKPFFAFKSNLKMKETLFMTKNWIWWCLY